MAHVESGVDPMKKIFVAIPTRGVIQAEAAHSLMELICDLTRMESEGYSYILGVMPRMLVAQAREVAVEKALELNCDYLFMCDDDMILPRNIVKRLISHGKDIVGSMSFERLGDHSPNIYALHSYQKNDTGDNVTNSMRWRNILAYEQFTDADGVAEVDVIGFGAVLIDMNVFKGDNAMVAPYFMSQFNVGEDFFFCWKAKEKGLKVFADCHISWQSGHIGEPVVITDRLFKEKLKVRVDAESKTLSVAQV